MKWFLTFQIQLFAEGREREGEGEKEAGAIASASQTFRETKKAFVRAELCELTENSGS